MNPEEEIKELKAKNEDLEARLAKVENYTTSIGGSLEFRNLIREYSNIDRTITNLVVTDTVGFFGADPIGQQVSIADPAGGITIDSQARSAINDILDVLDNLGFTA